MKKIYLTIALSSLLFSATSQTVTEKQTALVVKKTATWCNPCGTWGWTLFEEIWNEVGNETVILEMHNSSSSGLYSPDANSFYSFHDQISSTPAFYVNTVNEVEYSSTGGIYPTITKSNVLASVSTTNAQSPIVNSAFIKSLSGNTLTVNSKVKFFQNTTGDYYIGVYIAEDNVQASQNGISGMATHKRIMRASATSNTEGTLISSGAISSGQEFTSTQSFTLNSSWNANNIKVFQVIWKKVGNDYKYVNAHMIQGSLSVDPVNKNELDLTLYPNITTGDQDITLEIKGANNEQVSIEVFSQIGQKVNTIYNGKLKSNQESFNINPTNSLSKGLYFVNVVSNNKSTKTLKVIIR